MPNGTFRALGNRRDRRSAAWRRGRVFQNIRPAGDYIYTPTAPTAQVLDPFAMPKRGVEYLVTLADSFGQRLAVLNAFTSLEYSRAANAVTELRIVVPRKGFDKSMARPDARIAVWRAAALMNASLDTDTVWLLRKWWPSLSADGAESVTLQAFNALELLRRRHVLYAAGTAYASKTDYADDMVKDIVRENLGASATDTTRSIATYLSIEADLAGAPSQAKSFAWRNVLTVCQEIAQASANAGTRLFFDVVSADETGLTFKTWTGQRGMDNSHPSGANPLIISPAFGSLEQAALERDYSVEWNHVTVGGQGTEAERATATAQDANRMALSALNRREAFFDARNISAAASLQAEADAKLRAGRPFRMLTGVIKSMPGALYGVHWRFGDVVTAEYDGERIDASIDAVRVRVQEGVETISVAIRAVGEEAWGTA